MIHLPSIRVSATYTAIRTTEVQDVGHYQAYICPAGSSAESHGESDETGQERRHGQSWSGAMVVSIYCSGFQQSAKAAQETEAEGLQVCISGKLLYGGHGSVGRMQL